MNIEETWYEGSPYVYAVAGTVSLSNYGSYIAIASGVMLLVASGTILKLRWTYRGKQGEQRDRRRSAEERLQAQRDRDERMKRVLRRKKQKKIFEEEI